MAHTIIVGAGIVGVSTAIWLQRAGEDVTLVDRAGPAAGTSFGNAGVLAAGSVIPVTTPGLWKKAPFMVFDSDAPLFLRWGYVPRLIPFLAGYLRKCNRRDVEYYAEKMLPLIYDSVEQHRSLARDTPAEDFIRDADYCFGYDSEAAFTADRMAWALREKLGLEFEVCRGEQYPDPVYKGKFHTVVRCKRHGIITDPGGYIKALADHFIDKGGTIAIAEVTGAGTGPDGRPRIATSQGPMDCDRLVLAAGAWSKGLLRELGVKVPLESERGYHIELMDPDRYPDNPMMAAAGKFVVTPMAGRIRCAGVVEFGGLEAGPQGPPLRMLRKRALRLLDNIKYDSTEEWLGHRPALTDSLPILGKIGDGIFTAFGHQHVGLTGGAKSGRIMSDLVTGKNTNIDMEPYRADRF